MQRRLCRIFCLIAFSALVQPACRLERREDFDFSADTPLRCGIFRSYFLVREVREEIYPDLGLLLANAPRLGLSGEQQSRLSAMARQCTELCEIKKDQLRLMQEDIKARLALNEIKGDLSLLARQVQAFERAKAEWLQAHAARYHMLSEVLNEAQRAQWQQAESYLKPFPVARQDY